MRIRKIISDAERTEKIDFAKERKSVTKAERTEKIDFAKERKSATKAERTEKIDFAKEHKSHNKTPQNLTLQKTQKCSERKNTTPPLPIFLKKESTHYPPPRTKYTISYTWTFHRKKGINNQQRLLHTI